MRVALYDGFDVAGRVCLVMGGTSGVGRAIAEGFARMGAAVTVAGRDAARIARVVGELRALGDGGQDGVVADVTDEAAIRDAFDAVRDRHGRLDILVNAVGITTRVPSLEMSLEDWERILRTNLTGTFLCCREAGRLMAAPGRGGCIINVASISAFSAFSDIAAYSCSKAAVVELTRSLANDWARHGIRVNAIAPGGIANDLNRAVIAGTPRGDQVLARTPQGRFGSVEEVVGAALYLASPAASFVTGHTLVVDGGFTVRGVSA